MPAEGMVAYPVSRRVNNPRHDDPECIAPLRAAERADQLLEAGDLDGERVWLGILKGMDKLIKIDAKVVRHSTYITFQVAEVAIPRRLFAEILRLIDGLRPKPAPT